MTLRPLSVFTILTLALLSASGADAEPQPTWPTPNRAFAEGKDITAFIQPTASGNPHSGLFGCVRNSGHRFHEGIDLLPIGRDSRGEATDEILAVFAGRVAHVSEHPGVSSYGRYIVVEHTEIEPPLHTLYAHLAKIAPGIREGARVEQGQALGVMGRSAGASPIPRHRAHLHLEIGARLSNNFQSWYDWKGYGSKNRHGNWNGMNLVGLDPLDFYTKRWSGEADSVLDYIEKTPTAFVLRVASPNTPSFVHRYPALVKRPLPQSGLRGWDISFTSYGFPKHWKPLTDKDDPLLAREGDVTVVALNEEAAKQNRCRDAVTLGNIPTVDDGVKKYLQLMFDFRE